MSTSKMTGAKEPLRLMLVGLQGVGKSAAGNTILGHDEFQSDISSTALTLQTKRGEALIFERPVMVLDTPGLFGSTLSDIDLKQELEKALTLCQPGPHVFLIIIQLGRFTEQERSVMDKLIEMLGVNVNQYCMVLFTHGDKLKNKTIDQFVKEDKNLMKLINKCGGQYKVFNNANPDKKAQVRELLEKIDSMIKKNHKRPFYIKTVVQYSCAKILFTLSVVTLIVSIIHIKMHAPKESLSQLPVKEGIDSIPEHPENILDSSSQFWQLLHGLDFSWKGLIPVAITMAGTGWLILRKLRK